MRLERLEEYLAHLLGEPNAASPALDAAHAAELAARLRQADGPGLAAEGDPSERLAAFFEGALDDRDRGAFEADLARHSEEREDLEAARQFLDRVTQNAAAAPEDLLAEALTALGLEAPIRAQAQSAERPILRFWRPRAYGVLGGAVCIALALLSVVPILREGARKPAEIAAPVPVSGSVGASTMTDMPEEAPRYIRQPAVLPPSLPQDASLTSPAMSKSVGASNHAPSQERLARNPKAPSDANVASNNCQTLAAGETPTTQNATSQSDKSLSTRQANAGCANDVMVGAQYPGISLPIAPVVTPSLGAVGAGADMPLPPQGHLRD